MEHDEIIVLLTELRKDIEHLAKRLEEVINADYVKRADLGNLIDDHLRKRNEETITKTNNLFTLLKNIGYGVVWFVAIGATANGLIQLLK